MCGNFKNYKYLKDFKITKMFDNFQNQKLLNKIK